MMRAVAGRATQGHQVGAVPMKKFRVRKTVSPREPVRSHALLSCGCVAGVDERSSSGDEAECPRHGRRAVEQLALDRARGLLPNPTALQRAVDTMLANAGRDAVQLVRELVVRLASTEDDVVAIAPVVRAGCTAGRCDERQVAEWLVEAGVRADRGEVDLASA
jgi:hypothetical protein